MDRRTTAAEPEWTALLVVGALAALVLLRAPGTTDVDTFLTWQSRTIRYGLAAGYERAATNYPPLSIAILWVAGKAALAAHTDRHFGIKVSLLLFLLASLGLFLAWRRDLRMAVALLLLLLPSAMALGYLDVYFVPALLGSLWALSRGRPGTALLLFSVSCLVKWQPVILGPFVAVHLYRTLPARSSPAAWARLLGPSLALAASLAPAFGPETLRAFGRAFGDVKSHPNLSSNALNFHWVVTYLLSALYPEAFGPLHEGMVWRLRPPTPELQWALRLPGLAFYGLALAVFARRERSFDDFLAFSVVGYLGYFTFSTGVHENHPFTPVLLAAVLASRQPSRLGLYLLWCSVLDLNQFFFYGFDGSEPRWSRVVGIDLSPVIAAVCVLLFLMLFLEQVWDDRRRPAEGR